MILLHSTLSKFQGCRQSHRERNRFRSRPASLLLMAAEKQRTQVQSPPKQKQPDPFRHAEFMAADRKRRHAQMVKPHWDFADSLGCVRVAQDRRNPTGDFADRLGRPRLVVDEHQSRQARIRSNARRHATRR